MPHLLFVPLPPPYRSPANQSPVYNREKEDGKKEEEEEVKSIPPFSPLSPSPPSLRTNGGGGGVWRIRQRGIQYKYLTVVKTILYYK